jgi:murein DD-endopeptidase MepM/ murein hydrolase activator NlpD
MESKKPTRWQAFKKKLHDKYRLVIMNDSTFERKISFRLTRMNVFVAGGAVAIFLIFTTSIIIAYTPLREFIPGYGDVNMQRELFKLTLKTDSMEKEIVRRNLYLENLRYVIEGRDFPQQDMTKPSDSSITKYKNLDYKISPEDSALRNEFESMDKYNLTFSSETEGAGSISSFFFFTPIKGIVVNGYNPGKGHFGIDIAAKKNDAVKSTLDGTVLFTGWTLETGYIISIQHVNNLVSVYKHNSVLLKQTGDYVKAGDPIAIVGETGEMQTGPHLHFELWHNGSSANPKEFMSF